MLWQPSLPDRYQNLSREQLAAAIDARRAELGDRLLILGHHYQQDDVIRHADLTGDSLKLSRLAAEEARRRRTEFIVFCGVHFMAETADILTEPDVQVILPDLSAGCSMADMADYDDCVEAWDVIREVLEDTDRSTSRQIDKATFGEAGPLAHSTQHSAHNTCDGAEGGSPRTPVRGNGTTKHHNDEARMRSRLIPITYVNSTAAIKAFVGEHGGACCTSSNAEAVFQWALAGGDEPLAPGEDVKLLFIPDQHLGRNTASKLGLLTEVDEAGGLGASETVVWNPKKTQGGLTDQQIREARLILWAGHCSVHKLFRPEHVDEMRARFADDGGVTVIVHPECDKTVVDKADLTGSTERIIAAIQGAAPGTNWAIGTEVHLVNRLANEAAQRGVTVRMLSDCQCLCTTMYRIEPKNLLWALDHLAKGTVVNRITVPPDVKRGALLALERMLGLAGRHTDKSTHHQLRIGGCLGNHVHQPAPPAPPAPLYH